MRAAAGASFPDRRSFYEASAAARELASKRFYHQLLERYYRFLIPPGARVLEIGCGFGRLLSALKPSRGVGIDFCEKIADRARILHPELEIHTTAAGEFNSEEKFDYIILSDLANDLPDVQGTLEWLRQFATPRTRIVLNVFNYGWRPILVLLERLGLKSPTLPQNWLSAADMRNLLQLAGWELIKQETHILCPARIPLLAEFLNRWIAPLFSFLCLSLFQVARLKPSAPDDLHYTCSVVIPARNESGNIEAAALRVPNMGKGTEIIFIEGQSSDNTWEEIQRVKAAHPKRNITIIKQQSKGKGAAVREAFVAASGDLLFILDADLTVPPEQLPKFYEAARSGTAEFVNGVRLVYPMQEEAMPFLNMLVNQTFGRLFSWLLGQPIKDTLCGTKVLFRKDYEEIARNRDYFGDFDPFGDFDLLFGAAKLNLKIVDLPIRYQARTYGETNIHRWRHGWVLLRMVMFAARRIKFI
jgi:SAM-dependent methyltransferase